MLLATPADGVVDIGRKFKALVTAMNVSLGKSKTTARVSSTSSKFVTVRTMLAVNEVSLTPPVKHGVTNIFGSFLKRFYIELSQLSGTWGGGGGRGTIPI
jgi:hypothetical protein